MGKQCKPHLHNVVMFTLGRSILLVSMRARDMVRDANGPKKGVEFLIPLQSDCTTRIWCPRHRSMSL
jgi:hypothetical protein